MGHNFYLLCFLEIDSEKVAKLSAATTCPNDIVSFSYASREEFTATFYDNVVFCHHIHCFALAVRL